MTPDTNSLGPLPTPVTPLPSPRRKLEEGVTLTTGPTGIGKSTTLTHIVAELRTNG